jgi:DNA-3-methyladenine glycosylase
MGLDAMWADRPAARRERDLASGPGKLCAALGITSAHNGVDLLDDAAPVRLIRPADHRAVDGGALAVGPRIGISRAVERPWRFGLPDNPHLSRPF